MTRVREDRYRTQTLALAEMRRLQGLAISPSEYAQWEAGSRVPRADNPKVEALYEFFGSKPEDEPAVEPEREDLIAALLGQTAAITALVDELREAREARDAIEARLRALEAAAKLQERSGAGVRRARSAPLATAGSGR